MTGWPRGRVASAPHVRPRCPLEAARAADRRACDQLAAALDELLSHAPLVRTIGSRLLTREISRSADSTAVSIAGELGMNVRTLNSRIERAGGASIRQLRRELIVARLAALVEDPALPWSVITELLGVPRTHTILGLVDSGTNLPAPLWRERIRAEWQLERCRRFLAANAAAWSRLPPPERTARAWRPSLAIASERTVAR